MSRDEAFGHGTEHTGHALLFQRAGAWAARPADRLGKVPYLATPWQDSSCAERISWRQRATNLNGDFAFAVDYQICQHCRIGWVEQPYTLPSTGGAGSPPPASQPSATRRALGAGPIDRPRP